MVRQKRYVIASRPKRRSHDGYHVKTEEEVFAELSLLNEALQVLVRGRDHAHIHLDGLASAHALEFALLQCPEYLRLNAEAHIADLVQEERALVGHQELPVPCLHRPCECAPIAPEQLALNEFLGNGGTIHLDERALRSPAVPVDIPRDEFLAGPALPQDEYATVRGCHHLDLFPNGQDGAAFPDHVESALDLFAQAPVLLRKDHAFQGVGQRQEDLLS